MFCPQTARCISLQALSAAAALRVKSQLCAAVFAHALPCDHCVPRAGSIPNVALGETYYNLGESATPLLIAAAAAAAALPPVQVDGSIP